MFFLLVVSVLANYCEPSRKQYQVLNSDYTPIYVQTITRHGDRTSGKSYNDDDGHFDCDIREESHIYIENGKRPTHAATSKHIVIDKDNNPYASDFMWSGSCETGQLTPKGINQHYELGELFKTIYQDQLGLAPKIYNSSLVKVRASGKIRTVQSAQAFMQRFYPLGQRQDEITIKVETQPYDIETMRANRDCCPHITEIENEILSSDELIAKRTAEPFYSTLEKIKRVLQFTTSYATLYDYIDFLIPKVCHGLDFPCRDGECITQEDYDVLIDEYTYENIYFFGEDISQYQIGFFMDEMLDDAHDAFENGVVYQQYSGHDTTILPLLSILGSDVQVAMPYASVLVLEYYTKEENKYVRVLLNNEVLDLTPICTTTEGLCNFEEFEEVMRNKVPDYSECYTTKTQMNKRKIRTEGWYTRN
ncbi:Histidine acid phosphatase family protein [Entamoeba marina]